MNDKLFIGVYPCGLVYADKSKISGGDYKRVAFLHYDTLKLDMEKDCPAHLRLRIKADAKKMRDRAGTYFQISSSGQTVLLGDKMTTEEKVANLEKSARHYFNLYFEAAKNGTILEYRAAYENWKSACADVSAAVEALAREGNHF